jgi:hypothetical protein
MVVRSRRPTCASAQQTGIKIDVAGMTSLQVVEKGRLVHTIVAIVSQNVTQTIVGWKDLMAMGVISDRATYGVK